jgi:cysteine desulfurase
MPVYLDCNATTPIDPEVGEVVRAYLFEEFGNEGSRTHEYGARAKQAVQRARDQVAAVVGVGRDEVLFTSGATEANNLAILGLSEFGLAEKMTHVVTTAIEHKAVLEPIAVLERRGFTVTVVPVEQDDTGGSTAQHGPRFRDGGQQRNGSQAAHQRNRRYARLA